MLSLLTHSESPLFQYLTIGIDYCISGVCMCCWMEPSFINTLDNHIATIFDTFKGMFFGHIFRFIFF